MGLLILIWKTLCLDSPTITHIYMGRATTILFKYPELTLKCYCLYAPSQNDTTSLPFYEELFNSHPPDPTQNTIYIGDFNVVQNTTLDRKTLASNTTNPRPINTLPRACLTTPLLTHGELNTPIVFCTPGITRSWLQGLTSLWSQTTYIIRSLTPATPPPPLKQTTKPSCSP